MGGAARYSGGHSEVMRWAEEAGGGGARVGAGDGLAGGCGAAGDCSGGSEPGAVCAVNPHAEVALWANGAPGSEGKTAAEVISAPNADGERTVMTVNNPSIAPYVVRGARMPTAAVIVMPGGGHYMLSIDHEGYAVAQYLSGHGVAAFVLKYRLAHEKGSTYTVEGNELDDIQRAIRMVRANAAKWNVDPERVGVMGFWSAGSRQCWWRRGGMRLTRCEGRRRC